MNKKIMNLSKKIQEKEREEFKNDIKRKNWSQEEWKNSDDEIDRFLYWVNWLSLHNLWQARSVFREKVASKVKQIINKLKVKKVIKKWHTKK